MKLYGLMSEQRVLTAVIALLWAVQLVAHALSPATPWLQMLRFSILIVCAVLVMMSYWNTVNADDWSLLMLALLLTLTADAFFLFTNYQLAGILFFMGVQLVYIRRFARWLFRFCVRVVLAIALACAAATLLLKLDLPLLMIAGGVYACLLILALVTSFGAALPLPNRRLAQIGMILFVLCDIHVALFQLLPASSAYSAIAFHLIWLFYPPSQCLLALSATAFSPVPARLH